MRLCSEKKMYICPSRNICVRRPYMYKARQAIMSTEWGEPYSGHALILLRKCTQYEFPVISKGILLVWIQPKLLELIKESLHLWEERRGGRSFTFILYPQCIYTWFISYTHHLNIMCRLEQKQVMWQIGNTKTPKNKNKNKNNPDHYMTRCLPARVIIVYGVEMVLCVIASPWISSSPNDSQ